MEKHGLRNMEKHGKSWKSMEKHGLRNMEKNGKTWV